MAGILAWGAFSASQSHPRQNGERPSVAASSSVSSSAIELDQAIDRVAADFGRVSAEESRRLLEAIQNRIESQHNADPAIHALQSAHVLGKLSRLAELGGDLPAAQEYAQRAVDAVQNCPVKGVKKPGFAAISANQLAAVAFFNQDMDTARKAAMAQLEMKAVQSDALKAAAALNHFDPANSDDGAAIIASLNENGWLGPLVESTSAGGRGKLRSLLSYAYERRGQLPQAKEQLTVAVEEMKDRPTLDYLVYSERLATIVETSGRISDSIDVLLQAGQRADQIRSLHDSTKDGFTEDITRELGELDEGICNRLQSSGWRGRPDAALWAAERMLDRNFVQDPPLRKQLEAQRRELLAMVSAGGERMACAGWGE